MELKLYFRMLQRNWWLMLLTAMVALTVSLSISYAAVPLFRSTARFIISPSPSLTTGGDVVRSLDTLDRPSVAATYAEVMNSDRIFVGASESMNLDPLALVENYEIEAVVLPDSSVLELDVSGPDSQTAADLANAVGYQTIDFTRSLNLVYDLNFLDTAAPSSVPFSPEPLRDGVVALVLGIGVGAILAVLSEQIRIPIEAYRQRLHIDSVTGVYNANYFSRLLEEEFDHNPEDVLTVGLVELNGLLDFLGTLPPAGLQALLLRVTGILRRELRGNDIIARWSETSFAIMLPLTDGPASGRTLNRIYQALLQSLDLPDYGVSVNLDPHIGGAVYSNNISAQELLERAQSSLEQARRGNGQRAYIWEMKSPFWIETEKKE